MKIKALVFGAAMVGMATTSAQAADVLIAGTGAPYALTTANYTQDFDSLKSVTSDGIANNALPAGWQVLESGNGANGSYQFGSASSATAGAWSYGLTGERALGGRASPDVNKIYVGAIFENALGAVIDGLDISYTGEQWQNGYNRATMQFQYSLDATSLNTGTWTAFSELDFLAPNNAPHLGSQFGVSSTSGNSTAFQTPVSGLIDGLSIGAGDRFGLRWALLDIDGPGVTSDDGLAIDKFQLTATTAQAAAVPEPATWAMMIAGFGLVGSSMRRRRRTTLRFA